MTIRSIIVEDEEKGRIFLRNILHRFCEGIEVIAEAASVAEGVQLIRETKPDLVFLDIEMPGENGLHLFYHFEEINFEVIFTTAYSQYAIKALRMAALDYLLKPIDLQELKLAIDRFREKHQYKNQQLHFLKNQMSTGFEKLALPVQDGLELVEIKHIVRIEASGSYSRFSIYQAEKLLVAKTLREYDEILEDHEDFLRVHRSHIINRQYVQRVIKTKAPTLVMHDGYEITGSVAKRDYIFKSLLGA